MKYAKLGNEVGQLVDEKNAVYGDSFSKVGDYLRLLYPRGIQPEQYIDALALVRDFDKSMRIATNKDAFGESPWRDKAGYALLGLANANNEAIEGWYSAEDTRLTYHPPRRSPGPLPVEPATPITKPICMDCGEAIQVENNPSMSCVCKGDV